MPSLCIGDCLNPVRRRLSQSLKLLWRNILESQQRGRSSASLLFTFSVPPVVANVRILGLELSFK